MNWDLFLVQIVTLLTGIAWPVTAAFSIYLIGPELRTLIKHLKSAKLHNVSFDFGEAAADALNEPEAREEKPKETATQAAPAPPGAESPDWKRIGSVYWLGHDIMWTIDAILRGASSRDIMYGLRQAVHQMNQIGLEQTAPGARLLQLGIEASRISDTGWAKPLRDAYSKQLRQISDQIGHIAERQQPGYQANPAEAYGNGSPGPFAPPSYTGKRDPN